MRFGDGRGSQTMRLRDDCKYRFEPHELESPDWLAVARGGSIRLIPRFDRPGVHRVPYWARFRGEVFASGVINVVSNGLSSKVKSITRHAATALAAISEGGAPTLRARAHLTGRKLSARRYSAAKLTVEAGLRYDLPVQGRKPGPRIDRIQIRLAHVQLEPAGLPQCPLRALRGASRLQARARCGNAVIGGGSVRWPIRCRGTACRKAIPKAAAAPTDEFVAFNGSYRGGPAIFAHATGYEERSDFVLVLVVERSPGRTVLAADASPSYRPPDSITGLTLSLGRRFRAHGHPRAFLLGSCEKGSDGTETTLGDFALGFSDDSEISSPLDAKCGA